MLLIPILYTPMWKEAPSQENYDIFFFSGITVIIAEPNFSLVD